MSFVFFKIRFFIDFQKKGWFLMGSIEFKVSWFIKNNMVLVVFFKLVIIYERSLYFSICYILY